MKLRRRGYLREGRRKDLSQLGLASIVDDGVSFRTGQPVSFVFYRYKQKTQNMGSMFGQDIEPAGRYLSHKTSFISVEDGQKIGDMVVQVGDLHFRNPIVLKWVGYGEDGWKARLSRFFGGKKKSSLSRAIRKAGYDGIVTVHSGGTSEIVDLTEGR